MSACGLVDQDMGYVLKLVTECRNCKAIDLRNNQIGLSHDDNKDKTADWLLEILVKHKSLVYVDVLINPLASLQGNFFFERVSSLGPEEQFHVWNRLIWIPDAWVHTKGWLALIKGNEENKEQIIHSIFNTHDEYYKSMSRKQHK